MNIPSLSPFFRFPYFEKIWRSNCSKNYNFLPRIFFGSKKIPIVSWNIFDQFLSNNISFYQQFVREKEGRWRKNQFPQQRCNIRDSKISPNTIMQSDVRHFDSQMQFYNSSTISSLTRWKQLEDVQARRERKYQTSTSRYLRDRKMLESKKRKKKEGERE